MPEEERRAAVCRAAMELIAERGLEETTLRAIGELAGMSAGHVLYYFGSRDGILVETLAWSEAELTERRRATLAKIKDPWKKLRKLADLFLPDERRDPRWALWMEVTRLAPDDPDTLKAIDALEQEWVDDLADIIRYGTASGIFSTDDADGAVERISLLWEGLATQVYSGSPSYPRSNALRIALDATDRELS
ncbi:MAG: TetR/AcrR family transcriptional regulator [Actinomycetota bacterium]